MKTWVKVLIALALIVLPVAARWAWFNRGWYQPPPMTEIDDSRIEPPLPQYHLVEDQPQPGHGRVILDLAHGNNLQVDDLAPLRDRIEARGVPVDAYASDSEQPLKLKLRGATALVVLAPTTAYTEEERQAIADFVRDGGRLLLAADPTRPVPIPPEQENLFTIFFPTSSTPAANSLATTFGVVFFDDYLYNLDNNEGNYRNIRFTSFDDKSPLTQDLSKVVFFASHSLRSDGETLIKGDEETRSPVRSGETGLAAASLVADGKVLALGDVTFLTPPYHTVADNDQFLSNIADWLAGAERQRHLKDFPYLYQGPVDLVQVSGELLDPRLVASTSKLEDAFEAADLTLTLRASPEPDHDALLLGVFSDTVRIDKYLQTAGISITVILTPTEEVTATGTVTPATPSATRTPATLTTTLLLTSTPVVSSPASATATPTATPTPTGMAESGSTPAPTNGTVAGEEGMEETGRRAVSIEGIGTIQTAGTNLFIVDRSGQHTRVIALAEDPAALSSAIDKLVAGDLSGCVEGDPVMICSTGVVQEEAGPKEEPNLPPGSAGPRLFILSDDDGPQGKRTGAEDFRTILGSVYTVTVWSTSQDGVPTAEDVAGYDAYIIDSGDYAYDTSDTETLAAFEKIEKANVMFIGEQPVPSFEPAPAALNDIEVADAAHPVAFGFEANQIITLLPSESGVPAVVIPETSSLNDIKTIFKRGPGSQEAGRPVVIAATDAQKGGRILLAGFAFYRLPEDTRREFALNAAKWLLEQP